MLVNERVKPLMVGLQQPSLPIDNVFSIMMESAATALQSGLKM